MKTIIIDDEILSIETLSRMLLEYDDIEVVGSACNTMVAEGLIKAASPDLVFLDVELPGKSGVDFIREVKRLTQGRCRVVMYTGHKDSMLSSFRNEAFDFLLKPVDRNELSAVIQRLRLHVESSSHEVSDNHSADINSTVRREREKLIFNTNSSDFRVVSIADIGLFCYNSDQRIWEVVVSGYEEPIRLKRNVNYETLLALDPCFVQVSQRLVININCLMEVCDNVCRLYPPFDHINNVKVARLYRKKLISRFNTI